METYLIAIEDRLGKIEKFLTANTIGQQIISELSNLNSEQIKTNDLLNEIIGILQQIEINTK